jgi:glycosyltransferase involved in cell wall biosynthesis
MSYRIAMVGACPYPVPQGSQVFLRESALAIQSRGHEVHLVVYGHGTGWQQDDLKVHRCSRVPGDTRTSAGPSWVKPLLDLSLLFTLQRVVRQEKIDLVFAHNYEALLVALAAGKRPLVYQAHNAMADELPHYFRWKRLPEMAGRWLDRTFPRRADRVIAPHRRLAGHLIVRGCDHARVRIVLPPLDARLFEPCSPAKEMPPVLYTGNLDAYQNLGLLFAAMDRVRARIPEARLLVATAEQAELPGAELVPTPGFDSLQRVLAQDSVFAVPRVSWSGYPIKILNAMAAGKAIVACESAAYPIIHEVNGLVTPDNDTEAFADALLRLMQDQRLRTDLGRNARETVLRDHPPEVIAAQLENIARELLGEPGTGA